MARLLLETVEHEKHVYDGVYLCRERSLPRSAASRSEEYLCWEQIEACVTCP